MPLTDYDSPLAQWKRDQLLKQRSRQALAAGGPQEQGPDLQDWESVRGGLNRFKNELDQFGQTKLNELNKRADALEQAKQAGKLRREEFAAEQQRLREQAVEYPWQHHIKQKGSEPGDIVDDGGIRKIRTKDGFEVIGFTPDFVKQNTLQLPDGGMAVPVSPKEYRIIEPKKPERDMQREADGINATRDAISMKAQDLLASEAERRKAAGDMRPLSMSDVEDAHLVAGRLYRNQLMQAKATYKEVMDFGVQDPDLQSIHGTASDPFADAYSRRPQPSMSPVPGQDAAGQDAGLQQEMQMMEQFLGSSQDKDERPTPHVRETFAGKLERGASTDSFYTAKTKEEMNANVAGYKEGDTVQLADGRRYVKDNGKFWQIPTGWVEAGEAPDLTSAVSNAEVIENTPEVSNTPAVKPATPEQEVAATPSVEEQVEAKAELEAVKDKPANKPPMFEPVPYKDETPAQAAKRVTEKWYHSPTILNQIKDGGIKRFTRDNTPMDFRDGQVVKLGEGKNTRLAVKWGDELFIIDFDKQRFEKALKAMQEAHQRLRNEQTRRTLENSPTRGIPGLR